MVLPHGLHIVATTDEGTRRALVETRRLTDGSDVTVVLLVPRVVAYRRDGDSSNAASDATALTARYRALAAAVGVHAVIRLCLCRRPDDVFQWMLGPRTNVVIGGRRRWWWPTAAERIALRLRQQGHHVVFAAT